MKEQPNPCPLRGVVCREINVQVRRNMGNVERVRCCLECGREIVTGVYNIHVHRDNPSVGKRRETYRQAHDRWMERENVGQKKEHKDASTVRSSKTRHVRSSSR